MLNLPPSATNDGPGARQAAYVDEQLMPVIREGLSRILESGKPEFPVEMLRDYLRTHNPNRPTARFRLQSTLPEVGSLEFQSRDPPPNEVRKGVHGLPVRVVKSGEYPVYGMDLPDSNALSEVVKYFSEEERVKHIHWWVVGTEEVVAYINEYPCRATLTPTQWRAAIRSAFPNGIPRNDPSPLSDSGRGGRVAEGSPLQPDASLGSSDFTPGAGLGSTQTPNQVDGSGQPTSPLIFEEPLPPTPFDCDLFAKLEAAVLDSLRAPPSPTKTRRSTLPSNIPSIVVGESHTSPDVVPTEVDSAMSILDGASTSHFRSVHVHRIQHPSDAPSSPEVLDRLTALLDAIQTDSTAVVIVGADRWRLVEHIQVIATLYFRIQRDVQSIRRMLNVLDGQLMQEREVDIDKHHELVAQRQFDRDEARAKLLQVHQQTLEETGKEEPVNVILLREKRASERKERRAREKKRREDIMGLSNSRAAVRMQSILRGHMARKRTNIRNRLNVRTVGQVESLLKTGRFPLIELALQSFVDEYGDLIFTKEAPVRTGTKPIKVWHVKTTPIPAMDDADISSEEEEWTCSMTNRVSNNISSAFNPLFDVENVHKLLQTEDFAMLYRCARDHAGIPAIQRRGYAVLERLCLNVQYAAYLSLHHKKKVQGDLLSIYATNVLRVPTKVSDAHTFSAFIRIHSLPYDCQCQPQFTTYFFSNLPAPLLQIRTLLAAPPSSRGAYIEQTAPIAAMQTQLHPQAPIFFVPDCLTADQLVETSAFILRSQQKMKKVLWISSRPDFTVYANGVPFFLSTRSERHEHHDDLVPARTVRNALVVDALSAGAAATAANRSRVFHPLHELKSQILLTSNNARRVDRSSTDSGQGSPLVRKSSLFQGARGSLSGAPGVPRKVSIPVDVEALKREVANTSLNNIPMVNVTDRSSNLNLMDASKPGAQGTAKEKSTAESDSESSDDANNVSSPFLDFDQITKIQQEELDDTTKPKQELMAPLASDSVWYGVAWEAIEQELLAALVEVVDADPEGILHYHALSNIVVPSLSNFGEFGGSTAFPRIPICSVNMRPDDFTPSLLTPTSIKVIRTVSRQQPRRFSVKPKDVSLTDAAVVNSPETPTFQAPPAFLPPLASLAVGANGNSSLTNHPTLPNRPSKAGGRVARVTRTHSGSGSLVSYDDAQSEYENLPSQASQVFKTSIQTFEEVRSRLRKVHGYDNGIIYRRMPFLPTFGPEWLNSIDTMYATVRQAMADPHISLAFGVSSPDTVFVGLLAVLTWAFEFNKVNAFKEGALVYPVIPTVPSPTVSPRAPSLVAAAELSSAIDPLETSMSRKMRHRTPQSRQPTPSIKRAEDLGGSHAMAKKLSAVAEIHFPPAALDMEKSASIPYCASQSGSPKSSAPVVSKAKPLEELPALKRLIAENPRLDLKDAIVTVHNILLQSEAEDVLYYSIIRHRDAAACPANRQSGVDEAVQAVCAFERYVLLLLFQCFLMVTQEQRAMMSVMQLGDKSSFKDFLQSNAKLMHFLNSLDPWEGLHAEYPIEISPFSNLLSSAFRWRRSDWMPNLS